MTNPADGDLGQADQTIPQYAYLLVKSDALDPDELTRRIGIAPTDVSARGSRRAGPPPRPTCHIWRWQPQVPPGVQLTGHLSELAAMLSTCGTGLRALVEEDRASVSLEIVRSVHLVARTEDLGLVLDRGLLAALTLAGGYVDIDEYAD